MNAADFKIENCVFVSTAPTDALIKLGGDRTFDVRGCRIYGNTNGMRWWERLEVVWQLFKVIMFRRALPPVSILKSGPQPGSGL